jgi:hypothetical protein
MEVLAPNENYALPPTGLARALNLVMNNTRGRGVSLRMALAADLHIGVAEVDLQLREPTKITKAAVPLVPANEEDSTVAGQSHSAPRSPSMLQCLQSNSLLKLQLGGS